jgi:4-diphosphocytidyl-2-C-methyl-D-erythritol kinase
VATRVRSYSKINLGLAIGAPRADGFHALTTLYQTLALYDVITVSARPARETLIRIQADDPRVPLDSRNTAWKMVERALNELGRTAHVAIHIDKRLPIQGGMGAGSANAAAALIGLERELGFTLSEERRLAIAAGVGSDVPLFLVGGAVLGFNRGEMVQAVPAVTVAGSAEIWCVVALPGHGVSTPQAFRDWDALLAAGRYDSGPDLHKPPIRDTLEELSRTYASVFGLWTEGWAAQNGTSGIFPEPSLAESLASEREPDSPENLRGPSSEQLHPSSLFEDVGTRGEDQEDRAGNSLLALIRTGIENDFETVVFPQYPSLREIKRHLTGDSGEGRSALYAALSGSGSALFGLYRSQADAHEAQQRLQQYGVEALVTKTLPRPLYWSEMFAE